MMHNKRQVKSECQNIIIGWRFWECVGISPPILIFWMYGFKSSHIYNIQYSRDNTRYFLDTPNKVNDKWDRWKQVSFEVCVGLHSIEYIYASSFRCSNFEIWIPVYKQIRMQRYDYNSTYICCTRIFTKGEILHTIFIMYDWYCISCITFKFFSPVSQRWYRLIWRLWLFFRIQVQHSHCSHHHIVHCLRAQLLPTSVLISHSTA